MLDHVGVDRSRLGPPGRGEQPDVEVLAGRSDMFGVDRDAAGTEHRYAGDRVDGASHGGCAFLVRTRGKLVERRVGRCGRAGSRRSSWTGALLEKSFQDGEVLAD